MKEKVVAITGASSGIGEATALALAERGGKIVLGARRLERLKALATRIARRGGEAAYICTDVRRREDLSRLVALAASASANSMSSSVTPGLARCRSSTICGSATGRR